jgi:uncharacterized protein (DUF1330 family)
MAAYYIALRHRMKDEAEFEIYHQKAPASLVGRKFKVLAQYGRTRVTSGDDPGVVAIMEFPTFEDAEAWYESPEYQEAAKHFQAGADVSCFILDGLDEPYGND